jgi:hypothetical protein
MAEKPRAARKQPMRTATLTCSLDPSRRAMIAALARPLDRTTAAELIVGEMARRQGHRHGPYFDWSLATELFRLRFEAAWAHRPLQPSAESLEEFISAFVDGWPEGAAALRVVPDSRDSIANPPYSKDGMWPAFLRRRGRV